MVFRHCWDLYSRYSAANGGDISHDLCGKRAGSEILFQMSGQATRLFFSSVQSANDANDANSPKLSSGKIQASQAIVFASVTFGVNATLGESLDLASIQTSPTVHVCGNTKGKLPVCTQTS